MDNSGEKRLKSPFLLSIYALFILGLTACETPQANSEKTHAAVVSDSSETVATPDTYPQKTVKKLDTSDHRPILYLTFDDGPNPGTKVVLDILQEEKVPATFFLIGLHAYGSPVQHKMLQTLRNTPDVMLCNHSYTHGLRNRYEFFYNHPDTVLHDFQRNQDSLHFTNKLSRTPGSNIWRLPTVQGDYFKRRNSAANKLYDNGFELVGWDWEWTYNSRLELKQTAEQLYTQIEGVFNNPKGTKMPGHLVLLAHDHTFTDSTDSARLRTFIKMIKANGKYRLALLDEYPVTK